MCVWTLWSEKPRKQEKEQRLYAAGSFLLFWTVIDFGRTIIHLRPPCCTTTVVTLFRPTCIKILGFGFERTFDARFRFSDSLTRTDRVDQDRITPATSKKETEDAKRRHLFSNVIGFRSTRMISLRETIFGSDNRDVVKPRPLRDVFDV